MKRSKVGLQRLAWWQRKREELALKNLAEVARSIHPPELMGMKPCSVCGKAMSIHPIYRSKTGRKSPGVMSNAPDRFDGFHTYNSCHRSTEDRGRHSDNMMRYGEDRRAYENWADGDWKAASWVMQEFRRLKISPDHVGPLSLGFSHRPGAFRPTTWEENTARRNRLSLRDVRILIEDERRGEQVVSWHTRYIWDALKHRIRSDDDGIALTELMRRNMDHVLTILAAVYSAGHRDFLRQFLHPEYAYYRINITKLDRKTGKVDITKVKGSRGEYPRSAARYERKAFEALERYKGKDNRRVQQWDDPEVIRLVDELLQALRKGDPADALKQLHAALQRLANLAVTAFEGERTSHLTLVPKR
jgi:hypothetical protein